MDQAAIFDVLRRRAYLIVALTIVTAMAGYGISFITFVVPEKYDASALVMVRPHDPIKIDSNTAGKEFLGFPVAQSPVVESASKTYIQIIQSPALIGEVVRTLNLDSKKPRKKLSDEPIVSQICSYFNYCDRMNYLYDNAEDYLKNAITFVKYGRIVRNDPFTEAVNEVTKGLVLRSYEDTYVFEIKYSADDPRTAAAVANTTAKLFIQFLEDMRSSEAKAASGRLKAELEESRQRLVTARESLRDYKVSHQVFLTSDYYDAKLRVISDLSVDLAKLDARMAASPVGVIADDKKRARLVKSIDEQRTAIAQLPTIERELQLRQSDVDVANTAYITISEQLKDAEITSDPMPEARLISAPLVSKVPTSPHRGTYLGTALLAGLLFGVTLAFFLEYMNHRVQGIDDVEEFVGLKVIGTIPRVRAIARSGAVDRARIASGVRDV